MWDWLKANGLKPTSASQERTADQSAEAAAIGRELLMLKARADAAQLSTLSYLVELAIMEAKQF